MQITVIIELPTDYSQCLFDTKFNESIIKWYHFVKAWFNKKMLMNSHEYAVTLSYLIGLKQVFRWRFKDFFPMRDAEDNFKFDPCKVKSHVSKFRKGENNHIITLVTYYLVCMLNFMSCKFTSRGFNLTFHKAMQSETYESLK